MNSDIIILCTIGGFIYLLLSRLVPGFRFWRWVFAAQSENYLKAKIQRLEADNAVLVKDLEKFEEYYIATEKELDRLFLFIVFGLVEDGHEPEALQSILTKEYAGNGINGYNKAARYYWAVIDKRWSKNDLKPYIRNFNLIHPAPTDFWARVYEYHLTHIFPIQTPTVQAHTVQKRSVNTPPPSAVGGTQNPIDKYPPIRRVRRGKK